jgi:hypothetical protein
MASNLPVGARAERHLRVEAGPAQWQEFDKAQRDAYLRIARMISEAIGDMPPIDSQSSRRDAMRRTRSAFVIGGRGTGKTTVLDTFRRDSLPDRPLQPTRHSPIADDPTNTMERETLLRTIAGRVVWLETLDMEPLPPETNLLASILARLEEAAKGYSGGSAAPRKPRALVEPSSEYHEALLDLQRLQTDVALAWDGNLRQRQGALDPDAYAVEVMRVERARLSLNTKFADTLQGLATHVFDRRDVQDPLFILPIDDFDLNPPICLDLLRVLRLISIPRLFTIILGDLNVASTVLSLKLSSDLGSIVKHLEYSMLAVGPDTVASLAGDVAANAIRKLLPPGQRIELRPMYLAEAMNFRLLGSNESDLFLHELLGRCPVYTSWELRQVPHTTPTTLEQSGRRSNARAPASLRQLLLAPALARVTTKRPATVPVPDRESAGSERVLPTEVANESVYSGTLSIQASPRRIADMWLELFTITQGGRTAPNSRDETARDETEISDAVINYFAEACRAALRETPSFKADERDEVERAVSQTVAGAWTLRALPLSVRSETLVRKPLDLTTSSKSPRKSTSKHRPGSLASRPDVLPGAQIETSEALGWQMVVFERPQSALPVPYPTSEPGDRRARRLLSHGAATALIVYHDLLTFSRSGAAFATPLLTPSNVEIDWAATEWKTVPPVRFPWPVPPCVTFFDFDQFKSGWNEVIKDPDIVQPTSYDRVAERLVFAWIAIGTAVITRRSPSTVASWAGPLESNWRKLLDQLDTMSLEMTRHEFVDATRYHEWLKRVAELMMPEMGLPREVLQGLPDIPDNLETFWKTNHLAGRQRRAERLRGLQDVDDELAASLAEPVVMSSWRLEPREYVGEPAQAGDARPSRS